LEGDGGDDWQLHKEKRQQKHESMEKGAKGAL
jgi:hypothetical protein